MIESVDLFGIHLACYTKSKKAGEQVMKEYGVSFIISGELEAFDGKTKYFYRKGDMIVYRKNALIRFVKYPYKEEAFQAISVVLDEVLLQEFARTVDLKLEKKSMPNLLRLEPDELLTDYFTTVRNWFHYQVDNQQLITLKKKELIHLLYRHNASLLPIFFDFAQPGKVDLESYMNTHFRFNIPLADFAFLTGRSLASFKRDFEKIFHNSPSKWLVSKRLDEAYYLLEQKNMKVKEVYLEVGFETLAHFSHAFKQKFGINPSTL
ncbi:helix-turn-helix transcriptional regulator [Myroides sp. 1354]|uniref:helix-turn-helix domain-containing protein n=1 Tax=unclassified Myroides TaxID=2642485 RepID=UPI002575BF43|nr:MULTISPECIES: AraC family transcriptional regulator [unclassified Myroides]MDM1044791.1 helix-turn-helix transcriptional regulator [Myroides sp. R163-1]MDM1055504.1 helix-turn-helix transcriptional regulator [Myroides sp. 1354]MDM1068801.1 helix-turn-helix transcriptional regulator [Myroides sp. 1372]